ncbi:MAG: hypothetical protein ACRCYM_03180 [Cetobacterium sp.]
MKKMIFISILILKSISFANETNEEFNSLREKLTPKQQEIFDEVFDTNEMLLDSYKVDLKYLKSSDFSYLKKSKFLESKIQELEKNRNIELEKLKKQLLEHPERYKK